ncbi:MULTISPECIES: hypothetical protein [Mumia]|uniref:hypothetical protein n=1 Tax=Mumia TaxID=1546255 RepID=UPI001421E67A|nr:MULTISPECIES: hypothetical protein [unclassified Mumia]QMW66995.1 hypothetical protein H4N58_03395 [Mumia sp. ZJ1417]
MNDDEIRRRLDDLAAYAPEGDELRERWEAASRTRHTGVVSRRVAPVAAVLAAAAVLVVAGVGLSGLGDDVPRDAPQATAPSATTEAPSDSARVAGRGDDTSVSQILGAPGAALREVGRGRIVVSVPETWRWETPQCDEPVHSAYFFTVGVFKACASPSSTTITTLRIDSLAATGQVEGDPTLTDSSLNGVAYGQERSIVDGVTRDVIVVPSEDVRLIVKGSPEAVDAVVRTLRLLPADEVTVPQLTLGVSGGKKGYAALPSVREMEARLERVGLGAQIRTSVGTRGSGKLRVTPAPGAVVDVGTVVRVERVGG